MPGRSTTHASNGCHRVSPVTAGTVHQGLRGEAKGLDSWAASEFTIGFDIREHALLQLGPTISLRTTSSTRSRSSVVMSRDRVPPRIRRSSR